MVLRHEREIIRALHRINRLRLQYNQAAPEAKPAIRDKLTQATKRLDALRRDVPLQTECGKIVGRKMNG